MNLTELLEDVEEQKELKNVIFDADSILFLSSYRFRDSGDMESMYIDFWQRIKSIEMKIWETHEIDEVIISFTSKKNFRHDLIEHWKSDRKDKENKKLTDKQREAKNKSKQLRAYVSELKKLIHARTNDKAYYKVMVDTIIESDDRVCYYINHKDYIGVAIDSDIINQSSGLIFNNKKWEWMTPRTQSDIHRDILSLAITGTHNGTSGVKGKGKVFVNKFLDDKPSFTSYIDLFPTPQECLENIQVVSCIQYDGKEVKLHSIKDISDWLS